VIAAAGSISFYLRTATTLAKAAELETTHLFGFTLGRRRERGLAKRKPRAETVGRFWQGLAGAYGVLSEALGYQVPFRCRNLSLEAHNIWRTFSMSPAYPAWVTDGNWPYEAASLETRYRLINREKKAGLRPYRWL